MRYNARSYLSGLLRRLFAVCAKEPLNARPFMIRRHYASVYASPTGIDLACLAAKSYGAVHNALTSGERIKFIALQDVLDHYDEIGLQGIREMIRGT